MKKVKNTENKCATLTKFDTNPMTFKENSLK